MSAYEISPKAARIIHSALLCYAHLFDKVGDELPHALQELIGTFEPPLPPTAAELANALRLALDSNAPAHNRARDVLRQWEATQP